MMSKQVGKRNNRARKGEGSIYKTTFVDKRTGKRITRWQAQVVVQQELGPAKRKTVYGKSHAEVLEKKRVLERQIEDGMLSNSVETVKSFLDKWLKEKERKVKPRTAELYKEQAERYVIPRIGKVRLDKLTPMKVQAMMNNIADQVSLSAANKSRTLLHAALKQAVRWQLVPRNVVEAVDRFKEEHKELVIWTPADAVRFLVVTRSHRLYMAFYLAVNTGMRRGEVLGLRWQDVDGTIINVRQSLTIVGGKPTFTTPKTDKAKRRVAITVDVLEELERHRRRQEAERFYLGNLWPDTDLVFTSEVGTLIHPRNFDRAWQMLQEKARAAYINDVEDEAIREQRVAEIAEGKVLPKVRIHDLRHLNVSIRRKEGQDASVIADQIGHTDPAFTMRVYTHLFEDDRQSAAISLKKFMPPDEDEN